MDLAVRRFARNILLIHIVLLAVLLGVVYYAARSIEQTARQQALAQAQSRQELLTSQTARGIENFYRGIMDDMDLLPRTDDDPKSPTVSRPTAPRTRQPGRQSPSGPAGAAAAAQRGNMMGIILGRQLDERASHLFIFDARKGTIFKPILAPIETVGPTTQQIVTAFETWLKDVTVPTISTFKVVGGEGINLVCLPLPQGRVAVAVVPVRTITSEFISSLNQNEQTAAYLVDHSLNVMAASRPSLVGLNLSDAGDSNVKQLAAAYQPRPAGVATVFEKGSKIGAEQFPPALITASPIDVVPGRQWSIVIASPLKEIDRIVSGLFDRVFWGAVAVMLAITAILISTGVQMIRGGMRMERLRREVLERELGQAREIQLAWLPRGRLAHNCIDMAAVNQPASHISGDFYNWFELPDGRIAIVIGDVTGHGMAAAFLMATTQLLVRNTLPTASSPGDCLEQVNRQLCVQVFNGQFVTMQIVVVDPQQGQIEVATAGHPAPLMCAGCHSNMSGNDAGNGRAFKPLPLEPQLVLGVESDSEYPTERFPLPDGASLLLYTDGVTELEGEAGKRLYGEGLQDQLGDGENRSAEGLLDAIVKSLTRYRGTRDLGDDLTIVAVRFTAERATKHELEAAVV